MRRLPAATHQHGHIDNRPVLVVVLVLAAVAAASLYTQRTGTTPGELLGSLSPLARGFLVALGLAVVGAVLAAVLEAHRVLEAGPFPVRAVDRAQVILGRNAGPLATGSYLLVTGTVFAGFGVAGDGAAWVLVLACGLAALLAGTALLGVRRAWVAEAHAIRSERRWFGRALRDAERVTWGAGEPPTIDLQRATSGGAFGQPLVTRSRVAIGGRLLFESGNEGEAEAFVAALRAVYPSARVLR
jgi:hypothetical protein